MSCRQHPFFCDRDDELSRYLLSLDEDDEDADYHEDDDDDIEQQEHWIKKCDHCEIDYLDMENDECPRCRGRLHVTLSWYSDLTTEQELQQRRINT